MKLRGIDFGNVAGGSGVQGFFGGDDEYPHHRVLKPLGLIGFGGMTFVAKTVTLEPNVGNLPMVGDPKIIVNDWRPKCIHVSARAWLNGVMLNKVGLSNPGAEKMFVLGRWQRREEPFMLSFMSLKPTAAERLEELVEFVRMFRVALVGFRAPVALQINVSCPNVGVDHSKGFVEEVRRAVEITRPLGIPILVKVDALTSPYDLVEIGDVNGLDGIVTSNAVKFGTPVEGVDWEKLYGFRRSPLEDVGKPGTGGGGASGALLFPLVERQVTRLRALGFRKAIQAGGGVRTLDHVRRLKAAGADSVFIASAAILAPWSVQSLISGGNAVFGGS